MTYESACLICESAIELTGDELLTEIVTCAECGQEHEVTALEPAPSLSLAPEVEEDWGE
jgi:lysine biosynthesis protein LysW